LGLDRAGNLFVPGCPERVLFAAVLIWISFGWDVFARRALALLEWIGIAAHHAVFRGFTIRSLPSWVTLSNASLSKSISVRKRQRLQPSGGYDSQ
jgi:hypothetical protein